MTSDDPCWQVDNLRSRLLANTKVEREGLGQMLRGTGPWRWGSIARLYLFGRGLAYVPDTAPPALPPAALYLFGRGLAYVPDTAPTHRPIEAPYRGALSTRLDDA